MTAGEVLLVDHPGHPYAVRFMQVFADRLGMGSVCLYLDEGSLRAEADNPALTADRVTGLYLAVDDDYEAIADVLRAKHDIRAVVPYIETALMPSIILGRLLDVSWARNPALELFRNKHGLKEHLRSLPDGPRINNATLVRDADDVAKAVAGGGFDRFVLKPNGGFGNADIGFFTADTPPADIAAYLTHVSGDVLMEEFVAGDEFAVNGQVDEAGTVTVMGVYHQGREEWNGRANVQTGSQTVPRTDPRFAPLRDYAEHAIGGSGLRRSPFHAEIKLDGSGPCLIEVGARLAGAGGADDLAVNHGGVVEPFALAAHYYATTDSAGPIPLDWDYYDSHVVNTAMGVSQRAERIWDLHGIAATEQSPAFRGWVKQPHTGQRVPVTVDLESSAWVARFETESDEAMARTLATAREEITWNHSRGLGRLVRKVAVVSGLVVNRVRLKLAYRRLVVERIGADARAAS